MRNAAPELRSVYNTCTDTNGPSSNVYIDAKGVLNPRLSDEANYWDPNDPRPWAKSYAVGE